MYPMRNYVHRLVTTSFRLIIPLSLPGPMLTHLQSHYVQFSSVSNLYVALSRAWYHRRLVSVIIALAQHPRVVAPWEQGPSAVVPDGEDF